MTGYLLDTNVLSELIRKRPSERVIARMRSISSDLLATSSICVAELRYGAARHPQGEVLWERISQEILPRVEIVPLGLPEAERAGDLIATLEARGLVIGIEDVLIGATGLVHQRTMVTAMWTTLRGSTGSRSRTGGISLEVPWDRRRLAW